MTDKDFLKKLGLRLKCERIMKELSTNEVADKTGLSRTTILDIEKGLKDFHILTLKRIANTYNVNMRDLF